MLSLELQLQRLPLGQAPSGSRECARCLVFVIPIRWNLHIFHILLESRTMKTTYLNLHPQPNRRAEFWSCEDEGPILVITYKDAHPVIPELFATWLTQENFCVHICSQTETNHESH